MRKFRNQPPTPQQNIERLFRATRKLRYQPLGARIAGWIDGRTDRKRKASQGPLVESSYERIAREYFERIRLKIREVVSTERNMLRGLQNLNESDKANIVDRLPKMKREVEFAKSKLEASLPFGFSAWRWSSKAQLLVMFAIEAPLNLAAFMVGFGDSPLLTLSSVLAVSAAVPSASHAAGKLLKSDRRASKTVGAGFALLLVALVLSISILRRDAFETVAANYAGIVTSSSLVIALFYFLIQCCFIAVAIEMSYAYTKPVDEAGRVTWKRDQMRFALAAKQSRNTELGMVEVDHELAKIAAKLAWNAELETLSLQRVDSEYRELIEIYRRARWRDREDRPGASGDWLEKAPGSRVHDSEVSEVDATNGSRTDAATFVNVRKPTFGRG